jgi:hypothetical protein
MMTHMCMDIEGFMSHSKFPKDYRRMFEHDEGPHDEASGWAMACADAIRALA